MGDDASPSRHPQPGGTAEMVGMSVSYQDQGHFLQAAAYRPQITRHRR
jgi:hypothetical protein